MAARKKKSRVVRRRIHHAKFLLSVFLVLASLTAGYLFLNSAFFNLREIKVTGVNVLQAPEIVRISGIAPGVNILKLKTRQAAELLQVVPLVEKVEIKRRLPATVEIIVTERKPVAVLTEGSGFLVVDKYRVVLRKQANILGISEPIVTGIKIDKKAAPGDKITSPELKQAIDLIGKMDEEMLAQISEINVPDSENILLYTLKGVEIRFGGTERLDEKQRFLASFLKDKRWQDPAAIAYVDLSFQGPPVIKYQEN